MKKEYMTPEIEMSVFDTEESITLTNGTNLPEDEYGDLFG